MSDEMHQPRDANGQFVSVATLFERERTDHQKDHDREATVTKATAERLERQVEQVAQRIKEDVRTALLSVAETARVHADAHQKEHQAHKDIHAVEKIAVDKAETQQRAEALRIAESLGEYKAQANEWRGSLSDQSARFVSREVFDATVKPLTEFRSRALGAAAVLALISGAVGAALLKVIGG